MLTTTPHRWLTAAAIACATIAGLLVLYPAPCLANVAPESGLLVHVQPVSGSLCQTPITDCDQITRWTSAEGPVEFLIFFMRGASWPGETICIRSLFVDLSWPDAWQLWDITLCGNATFSGDPDIHVLDLEWLNGDYTISPLPRGVIPVARLLMNVVGPGGLDIKPHAGRNPVELRHGCAGPAFVTYPAMVGAEAGMQCGHLAAHCGYSESACLSRFDVPALRLNASAGGTADSTIGFWADHWSTEALCPLVVDTHVPWCAAWVDPVYEYGHAKLYVTADAAGLMPGLYQTEIELSNAVWRAARCLSVQFAVEENPTSAARTTWGRIKILFARRRETNA